MEMRNYDELKLVYELILFICFCVRVSLCALCTHTSVCKIGNQWYSSTNKHDQSKSVNSKEIQCFDGSFDLLCIPFKSLCQIFSNMN